MKKQVCIIHKGGRVHTWGEDLQQGFIKLGYDAELLALRDRSPEEKRIEKNQRLRYWGNPATIQRLADSIRAKRPSLIIFLNTMGLSELAHSSLRKAARGAPMVSWLADHVQDIPIDILPNLDAVYTFDSASLPLLKKFYLHSPTKLGHLPLAVNPIRFKDQSIPLEYRRSSMVFVGDHSPDRIEIIQKLRDLGMGIVCYGPGAESNWLINKRKRLSPNHMSKLYGSHKAVLNMLQFGNTVNGVNLRAYEAAACGGIGTYPLTPDLCLSFEPDYEVIAYKDLLDLVTQMELITPQKMSSVLIQSQKRVFAEHCYTHRASTFLTDLVHKS